MKKGVFYGVGVGPGDPELLTLKAVRRIERCPVIAAPQTRGGTMLALEIAAGAVPMEGKTILPLSFPMGREPAEQAAAHGIPSFIRLPINPDAARLMDAGRVEDIDCGYVPALADTVLCRFGDVPPRK